MFIATRVVGDGKFVKLWVSSRSTQICVEVAEDLFRLSSIINFKDHILLKSQLIKVFDISFVSLKVSSIFIKCMGGKKKKGRITNGWDSCHEVMVN